MTVRRIRKQSGGLFSRRTIGLYAAGLSTRDIRAHLEEVYGLKVSADLISRVTDAVLAEVSDWQNRALEPMYPIVFLDALRVKIRDAESRQVKKKAVYVALGVTHESEREVLGLWIANNEGAKFWLSVMNNLRNIRHCRSDQWRNMAHRRRHPDRRRGRPQRLP
ncbi:MAG: transposase-like protein [Yoonia sp.]|jgi:transposase-like protein